MIDFTKMDKWKLLENCIKLDCEVDRLKWEVEVERQRRLQAEGSCPMLKSEKDEIIACVYSCDKCYQRREGTYEK